MPTLEKTHPMLARRAVVVALCSAQLLLTACHEFHPVTLPFVASSLPTDPEAEVRVAKLDGHFVTLRETHIQRDSLLGRESASRAPHAIAMAEIASIETSGFDRSKTLELVVGGGLLFVITALIVVLNSVAGIPK